MLSNLSKVLQFQVMILLCFPPSHTNHCFSLAFASLSSCSSSLTSSFLEGPIFHLAPRPKASSSYYKPYLL